MAAQSKPTSRWGSFFQQAVAGVESRLDTILADEEDLKKSREANAERLARKDDLSSSTSKSSTGAVFPCFGFLERHVVC
jgi:hypothetical protein